jgi:holo-[acyl-carrier protein] synthase
LPNIAVTHDDLGKPVFSYAPALAAYLDERALVAHLSISDETEYAVAFVVVERP